MYPLSLQQGEVAKVNARSDGERLHKQHAMNIQVVEHSILNGIEYCTFWFRSVVEMTRHQLLACVSRRLEHGCTHGTQSSRSAGLFVPGLSAYIRKRSDTV
jgi:hypothetical protein